MFEWRYSNYSKILEEVQDNFVFKNPRDDQLETISEIKEAIDKGYKYIILEAGTGTGKSAIAATLASLFDTSYILTVTKQLQDQYRDDFPSFQVVKGRSNFTCRKYAEDGIEETCDNGRCVVEGYSCEHSLKKSAPNPHHTCHYYYQKYLGLISDVATANYHYMFLELNYVEDFKNRNLLICDEAHNLESTLMNQLKLEFKIKDLKEYVKIKLSDDDIYSLETGDFTDWISFISRIRDRYSEELDKIRYITGKPELNEKISFMKKQITDCDLFISHISYDPDIWIFDYDLNFGYVEFKPLKIDNYAKNTLFKFADACIFMSATILDYRLFAAWLGISDEEIYPIRRKSPFDVKRNPIKTYDNYSLSSSLIDVNAPKTLDTIKLILENHKNDKGIIHTVSGKCRDFIMDNINDSRLITHSTKDRAEQLEKFKNSNEPLVFVSPSMGEGVDLPGDLCRFQIIYKIPYPDLGDKQISLRNTIDDLWYDYKTCLALVQTHGRGMRFEDDYCKTYFIDNRFKEYVKRDLKTNNFLPDSFRSAIDTLPLKIKEGSDDYFADEKFLEKIERKYRIFTRANQFLEDENYEGAIRFYTALIDHELFINDYHPYLKLARAYRGAELFEQELETIILFFKSGRYCPDNKLEFFKESLDDLSVMGYFDSSHISYLLREYKDNGALNKVLSNQPIPTAYNIKKNKMKTKFKFKYPPQYFDDVCRIDAGMNHDEKVSFKYRLYLHGKKLLKEKQTDKAIGFYTRLINHELFINDFYPYKKLTLLYKQKRLFECEGNTISEFLKSGRYCNRRELNWFLKYLDELAGNGNFDVNEIDNLREIFLKKGALNKSKSNEPVPQVKRLKKLNQTKRNQTKSDDYLKNYYSSLK